MAERRLLLKLSGELLCSKGGFGLEPEAALDLAHRLDRGLSGASTQLGLVIGGGNFLRGATLSGTTAAIDRVTGDHMGMLATVMNAIGLRAALEHVGREARVLSALHIHDVVEPFVRREAIRHLESGRVVLFAGGTGHPYFTTDTTASLRAIQIEADILAKGTKVRGVYSADPKKDPNATFYERLTYQEVLEQRLEVMDAAAISLCRDQKLAIAVFDMWSDGNIERVIAGERIGTLVE